MLSQRIWQLTSQLISPYCTSMPMKTCRLVHGLLVLMLSTLTERSMCCGTPPDCEWKAQAGNVCIASFDWSCSGICKSVEKMKFVHERCGEGEAAVWSPLF
ncbi:hypothetical protein HYC85_019968 [Camellia sinensis]|uniref:Uncharacterized protein n=1 Tax=Camellia sinensis TaxID=4442 RepID=A0A7J7GS56_CAMSI|nr:hypothetical protein HYC85_019968 [Camellia sinensis]